MIELKRTVDTKPEWKRNEQSETIINFLASDVKRDGLNEPLKSISLYRVTNDSAMRADLVTKEMHGYLEPLEGVLKFNGVSNPFSIDVGDVFYVWDITSVNNVMRSTDDRSRRREDIRKQYITPEKKSTIDPRLELFDVRSPATKVDPQKGKTNFKLPPNLADFGDQEITLVNGKLVLGGAVSAVNDANQEPLAKSEYISKLIKKKLESS